MIRTPSLRARVLLVSLAALAMVTVLLDTFVFVSLRARLRDSLVEVLDTREEAVRGLFRGQPTEEFAADLERAGIPAVVTAPSGATFVSAPPGRSFEVVPPRGEASDPATEGRVVELDDGTVVQVQVASGGVESTLRRLALLELGGTLAILLLALLVLRRVSLLVTRPIERIVQVAQAITEGRTHERLDPSDPTTELGRMAAAFDRTIDVMDQALVESQRVGQSMRRFLSDAAHQLRTPMAGLRASAESLLRDPDSPERDALLANIARESVRATRLVESLLRVARLESGHERDLELLDLVEVVEEERDRARTLAPGLDVSIAATGTDFSVSGDRLALKDALANLLDNARRFAQSRIDIAVEAELGGVRVTIHDDGPGIPAGQEEEVFDRFVSLEGNGSGLGLAIARAVVRAHGGEISADGSTFELFVPRTGLNGDGRVTGPIVQ